MIMGIKFFDTLLQSALKGEVSALNQWHQYQSAGLFDIEENEKALKAIDQILLEKDSPQRGNALSLRAYMHEVGQGGEVNYPEAIRLYQEAIQLGNATAMNNLAYMYHKGLGVAVNYDEAIRLYKLAIQMGNASAIYNLASMYHDGVKVQINEEESTRILAEAHKLDDTDEVKAFLIMVARRSQQYVFINLLTQLIEINGELQKKQDNNPDKYKVVYDQSEVLRNAITNAGLIFFINPPTAEGFKDFYETCDNAIKVAEAEFKKHRDVWNQIHPVIRGLLGVLAALTVIPGLVVAITSKQGYIPTFFSTPETNSQQKLSAFKKDFDKLEEDIVKIYSNYL